MAVLRKRLAGNRPWKRIGLRIKHEKRAVCRAVNMAIQLAADWNDSPRRALSSSSAAKHGISFLNEMMKYVV